LKKLLLGVVLIAALIAVSYFRVQRDSAQEEAAYERGRGTAEDQAALITALSDSLDALVKHRDSVILSMADSLAVRDQAQVRLVDSLTGEISLRDKQLAALKQKTPAPPKSTAAATRQSQSPDHEILAHYRQAVEKLPGDLSTYERGVAIREIRQETVQKFAITEARLNQIRESNHLDY